MQLDARDTPGGQFRTDRVEDGVPAVRHIGGVTPAGLAVRAREDQHAARGAAQHRGAEPLGVSVRHGVRHLYGPAGVPPALRSM